MDTLQTHQLSKLTKAELARRVASHPRYIWSQFPPIKWTKEELVQELIELESR